MKFNRNVRVDDAVSLPVTPGEDNRLIGQEGVVLVYGLRTITQQIHWYTKAIYVDLSLKCKIKFGK